MRKQLSPAWLILTFLLSACANRATDRNAQAVAGSPLASGGDRYYEYSINSTGRDMSIQGYSKLYLSAHGDARSEMQMTNSMNKTKPTSPVIVIGHNDKPNESIIIDEDSKTYSVHRIERDSTAQLGKMDCTATKIGEEDLAGFHCVHARIISVRNFGSLLKMSDTVDLWKSRDVPVEPAFKAKMDQFENKTGNYMYSPQVAAKLREMGCDGFMVKLDMRTKSSRMTELLVKTEQRALPGSLFEIPAGYKKTADDL